MNAFILDQRHSEANGLCDVHKSYVGNKRAVSRLMVKRDDGTITIVAFCRPCARALARNARLWSEA